MLQNSLIILGVMIIIFNLLTLIHAGGNKYIDLTYPFNNETVVFPGRKPILKLEHEGFTPEGFWIASKGFCISDHTGTHIDAPYHFYKYGRTLDQIPLEDLIDIPGVMINIYDKVHKYENGNLKIIENYLLTREDIIEWEKVNGEIPRRAVVLIRTGWGSRWPDRVKYQGLDPTLKNPEPNVDNELGFDPDHWANTKLNFPGLHPSGAKYLTADRQILGVGIDALSIDAGVDKLFPSHIILSTRGAYILENMAYLHLLPPKGFRLWIAPFKVDGATGAPSRILAKLD